ncbi:MAG: hypothetical protein WC887_01040 [Candidatus Paceibacterota bacterium]|jgi:hypothetical protein
MRYIAIAIFILFSFLPAGMAFAAQTQSGVTNTSQTQTGVQNTANTGQNVTLINPLGNCVDNGSGNCLSALLTKILDFVIRIGAIVIVFMLIYIGYLFVMARGVPGEITKAKEALKWTVIGALILLGAQAISLGIQATVQAISTGN